MPATFPVVTEMLRSPTEDAGSLLKMSKMITGEPMELVAPVGMVVGVRSVLHAFGGGGGGAGTGGAGGVAGGMGGAGGVAPQPVVKPTEPEKPRALLVRFTLAGNGDGSAVPTRSCGVGGEGGG